MASTRQLKSRVKSVKSTRQITKAMQLVAGSKMRKAQEATLAVQLFSQAARELLTQLRTMPDTNNHHLFDKRAVKSRLVILVTSDRGLAGAYNANVLKHYTQLVQQDKAAGIVTKTITIGRKGAQFAARLKGIEVIGSYQNFPEYPTDNELRPIVTTALKLFTDEEVDSVDLVYTKYKNSIIQIARQQQLLPAGFDEEVVSHEIQQAAFEPSAEDVLEIMTIRLIEVQLLQGLLDAAASEQSMRMIAMKNATDNAGDLIDDLTLEMNKVRQAAITQELAEISGGSEAMK